MSPILGIYASQISGHLFAPSGAYDSIATGVGTGSNDEITFSSIPSTYTHLQIRGIARAGGTNAFMAIRLNGVTSGYARHYLLGNGTAASAAAATAQSQITFLDSVRLPTASSTYGVFVCDILDYANTSKNKTVRILSGQDSNGSGGVDLTSGFYESTSAITSVTVRINGGSFDTPTQFALYGIKGGN